MELAAGEDKGLALAVVGGEEPVLHADPSAQLHCPGFFGKEAVRAALHYETVDLLGPDVAAYRGLALKYQYLEGGTLLLVLPQAVGRGKAGYAAPYYDYSLHYPLSP